VQAGVLPITVIARDRAGNETKAQLSVTVNGKPTLGAAATVGVTLANAIVKPGGFVTATIGVSNGGTAVAGQTVSLQVGVTAIGTAVTDATGHAVISFFAPANEGTAQVVVLAGNASGSTPLTIAK
jgi:sporulation-control protein spo0M